MQKRNLIITAALIIIIVVAASGTALYYLQINSVPNNNNNNGIPTSTASNKLPDTQAPAWQIKLAGDVKQEKILTLQDLTNMTLSNVTIMETNITYIGVSLFDFCNQSGIQWDAMDIQVIGQDGKNATIDLYHAWNSTKSEWYYYKSNTILLAFVKDGQWMTNQTDGGVVKLITPHFNDSYQISQVCQVNIKPWTIIVKGNVANPIILTAANFSVVNITTINAMIYSGGDTRTSNWTGLLIMDILNYANISDSATKVALIGIDGKAGLGVELAGSGNFTLNEISSANMIVGFQENGKTLAIDQGGPIKSFCPTTTQPFCFTTYWMKWLHEIVVY